MKNLFFMIKVYESDKWQYNLSHKIWEIQQLNKQQKAYG